MKTSGALLLFLFCVCEAGTDVHFELSIDHHDHENPEDHHENPEDHHENPQPVMTTTPEPHAGYGPYPICLVVMDCIGNTPNKTYYQEVAYRGVLIGAMRRIENNTNDFSFTYTENNDYGPYLESVNGLAGNATAQTYWQVLGTTEDGEIKPTDVGIGCYIPKPNEHVYLKYTMW